MRVSILCKAENIIEVRESAKQVTNADVLVIPVSPNGKEPETHWFCSLSMDDNGYEKLLLLKKHTIMEPSSPKEFLIKCGLKVIK